MVALCWRRVWVEGTGTRWNEAVWQSVIGVSPAVVQLLWASIPEHVLEASHARPEHLLWLLSWFRLYEAWPAAANHWRVCEKTFRVHVKEMLALLNQHLDLIHIEDRFHAIPFENIAVLVVDTTLCPVECDRKNWDSQKPYFSVKHQQHGLKYELAVHWLTGKLHWIAGGVYASMSDITIARNSGILQQLRQGEHILADKGYEGELQILTPFKGRSHELAVDEREWNRALHPQRVIVENAFARLHKFKILSQPFRGSLAEHSIIFRVIAQIAQLDIELHPLRKDVLEMPGRHHYYDDELAEQDPVGLLAALHFPLIVA